MAVFHGSLNKHARDCRTLIVQIIDKIACNHRQHSIIIFCNVLAKHLTNSANNSHNCYFFCANFTITDIFSKFLQCKIINLMYYIHVHYTKIKTKNQQRWNIMTKIYGILDFCVREIFKHITLDSQ